MKKRKANHHHKLVSEHYEVGSKLNLLIISFCLSLNVVQVQIQVVPDAVGTALVLALVKIGIQIQIIRVKMPMQIFHQTLHQHISEKQTVPSKMKRSKRTIRRISIKTLDL